MTLGWREVGWATCPGLSASSTREGWFSAVLFLHLPVLVLPA